METLLALCAVAVLIVLGAGFAVSAPPRSPGLSPPAPAPVRSAAPELAMVEGALGPLVSLDPQFAQSPAERSATALLFRGLTRLGPEGTIVPDLAERWEFDAAGTELTFFLRPDAYWHDGVHVSSDDVIFTVATLTDPAYTGASAADWQGVRTERVDRFTVRLHLPAALARYLPITTTPLVPAHLLSGTPVSERANGPFAGSPVGTGPFALACRDDDWVELRRVGPPLGGEPATYAPGPRAPRPEPTPGTRPSDRPHFSRYRFVAFPDAAALGRALSAGEIDAAAGLGANELGPVARDRDVEVLRYPGTEALALVPNLRVSTGPFFDSSVRRALSLAIDRGRIGAEVFGGAVLPANTLYSPASVTFNAEAAGEPIYDPDAARGGLLAAGWTETADGWLQPGSAEPASIEILVRDTPAPGAALEAGVAALVAQDWEQLGLSVDVLALPVEELVTERLRPGAFDVVLLPFELGLASDLYPLLVSSEAQVGGANIGGYQSSLMDTLLSDAREVREIGSDDRLRALQAALAREMPVITVGFPDHLFLTRNWLSGQTERQIPDPEGRYWDVLAWRLAPRPNE